MAGLLMCLGKDAEAIHDISFDIFSEKKSTIKLPEKRSPLLRN